jgi:hypothetical protein
VTKVAPVPGAGEITVAQTLELLEGPFASLAGGLADDRYALWIGSGISRDRLPGLGEVIRGVLARLHEEIDTDDAACPFRKALESAVQLADLRSEDREKIDFDISPFDWTDLDFIVQRLTGSYADFLAIEVGENSPDYLVWDIVDVCDVYGTPTEPDCEHLCLGILVLEGVVDELISANWDGLIEAAIVELAGTLDGILKVVVLPDDLRGADADAVLLKVHGCAVLAAHQPEIYRKAIVARRVQITDWLNSSDLSVIHTKLRQIASTYRALVIGLSVQDENLQQLFSKASDDLRWPWPSDPPAHVFAGESLEADQLNVLRVVYGEDTFGADADAIKTQSLIRAFGKPVLMALVLSVLRAKLLAFASSAEIPNLDQGERDLLSTGLDHLAVRLATAADADRLSFIRRLVQIQSHALALFRNGARGTEDGRYAQLGRMPVGKIGSDPDIATTGLREMAAALALLGRGEADGAWSISAGELASGTAGAFKVLKGDEEAAVFFTANAAVAVQLHQAGVADLGAHDTIIINSMGAVPATVRSPRASYGRTGETSARQVQMRELLGATSDLDSLEESFRQEAAL